MDVTYDDVRQSFLIRLHAEQSRLAFLCDALGSARMDPVSAFADLEIFAHRLRGAAAVFGLLELRDDSKALEMAAAAAVTENSPVSDPQVQKTSQTLTSLLVRLNVRTPLSNVTVLPIPGQ